MNNNALYFIVGALLVAVAIGGYTMYQGGGSAGGKDGVEVNVGKDSVSVQKE